MLNQTINRREVEIVGLACPFLPIRWSGIATSPDGLILGFAIIVWILTATKEAFEVDGRDTKSPETEKRERSSSLPAMNSKDN